MQRKTIHQFPNCPNCGGWREICVEEYAYFCYISDLHLKISKASCKNIKQNATCRDLISVFLFYFLDVEKHYYLNSNQWKQGRWNEEGRGGERRRGVGKEQNSQILVKDKIFKFQFKSLLTAWQPISDSARHKCMRMAQNAKIKLNFKKVKSALPNVKHTTKLQ